MEELQTVGVITAKIYKIDVKVGQMYTRTRSYDGNKKREDRGTSRNYNDKVGIKRN